MTKAMFSGLMLAFVVTTGCSGSTTEAQIGNSTDCKPGDFPVTCPFVGNYNQATHQFDIATAINLPGRVARIHYSVLAPGGVIGQHPHKNRPCFEYMLDGEAMETKQDAPNKPVVVTVKKDDVEFSPSTVTHWWKNQGKTTVRIIAVDIFENPQPTFCNCAIASRKTEFKPPSNAGARVETLGEISLAAEYPTVPAMKDYVMTSRRVTLLPGQATALENSKMRPSYTYVVKGSPVENRTDKEPSALRPEEFSFAEGDVSYFWENPTAEPIVLWVVAFEQKGASGAVRTMSPTTAAPSAPTTSVPNDLIP